VITVKVAAHGGRLRCGDEDHVTEGRQACPRGAEKMTSEYQMTPEQRTFKRIIDEEWESLSEAARTLVSQTLTMAYKAYLVHNLSYVMGCDEDENEVVDRAAAELTEHDCEGLAKIWCSAMAAAASIDPYDYDTHLGYHVYPADFHNYYKRFSRKVEDAERAKRWSFYLKELAEQEPIDDGGLPF
jgi:hypothetical protein